MKRAQLSKPDATKLRPAECYLKHKLGVLILNLYVALKKYGVHISKHVYTKKKYLMGVVNFNGGGKYEKTKKFNFAQFYLIQNNKALSK